MTKDSYPIVGDNPKEEDIAIDLYVDLHDVQKTDKGKISCVNIYQSVSITIPAVMSNPV